MLEQRVLRLIWPAISYTLLYSFLPHKELRFIIYVFPFFNIAVASVCHRFWENRHKTATQLLMGLGACAHIGANVIFVCFLLCISMTNYPGGVAIAKLHRLAGNSTNVQVHIDVLTAQTGVSRFTQIRNDWM